MNLHDEFDEYTVVSWHIRTIVHCMIDSGQVATIECQMPECRLPSRAFTKQPTARNQPDAVSLDHIVPKREAKNDRLDNLRLSHVGCNAGWRRGITGTHHTAESRAVISERAKQQHADGRGPDYSDPARGAKISAALTGKASEAATRGWATRRARRDGGD